MLNCLQLSLRFQVLYSFRFESLFMLLTAVQVFQFTVWPEDQENSINTWLLFAWLIFMLPVTNQPPRGLDRHLPSTLRNEYRNTTTGCSKAPRVLHFPFGVSGLCTRIKCSTDLCLGLNIKFRNLTVHTRGTMMLPLKRCNYFFVEQISSAKKEKIAPAKVKSKIFLFY
jgi:hypothetical protein